MADKKYQVFISSTFADLQEERRKILDILLMADCIPAGMEAFVASDVAQFEVIKKVIELCDYYILVIGKRYGSINETTGISYTEMEYEYAKELGIPVLVFALDESVEVEESKKETDPHKMELLDTFRKKALTNRLATIWKTRDDLAGAVAISIMRAIKEIKRPGWQRATDYDETSLRREIMELQKENTYLKEKLAREQDKLTTLLTPADVAYEDYVVDIKYSNLNRNGTYVSGNIQRKLPELFKIISIEMLDVGVNDRTLSNVLEQKLFAKIKGSCHFSDPQFVKIILNQFKVLGLIDSHWEEERKTLYWDLTLKGELERNRFILFKNNPSSDTAPIANE